MPNSRDAVDLTKDGEALDTASSFIGYQDRVLVERELANLLQVSVRTIQNWRVRGGGPPYIRISGRCIRYRLADVRRWQVERREEHTSNRELRQSSSPSTFQQVNKAPSDGAVPERRFAQPTSTQKTKPERERNPFMLYQSDD